MESNSNLGNLADAVIDRLGERGVQLIKKASDVGHSGSIPQNIEIQDVDFEEIQEGMLIKGLVHTTFDDFAEIHDIRTQQNEL